MINVLVIGDLASAVGIAESIQETGCNAILCSIVDKYSKPDIKKGIVLHTQLDHYNLFLGVMRALNPKVIDAVILADSGKGCITDKLRKDVNAICQQRQILVKEVEACLKN